MNRKSLIAVLLALCAAVSLFAPSVYADDDDVTGLYASISKNGQYIDIRGSFSSADIEALSEKELCLFAVEPGAYIGDTAPEATGIKAKKSITLQISQSGSLASGYVLAYEDNGVYTAVTNTAYISNPDAKASRSFEKPGQTSKKGLYISMPADAQYLGVSHTVIKLYLNEFITEQSDGALSYRSFGRTFYFDKALCNTLDHSVRVYTDAGMRVYVQLLLGKRHDGQPEYLYFSESADDADFYAINTYSKDACDALYAVVSYLTEKYTEPSGGMFCADFILGGTVNSNRYGNNAGPMSITEYTEAYAKALRIADCAARSIYTGARVYVPIGNNFNKPSSGELADPTLDYSVREFLTHLSSHISKGGDIPWKVSVSAYNIDESRADFRGLEGSEYSYDAQYLTMDNINILTSLLSQPPFTYNGQRRGVIIGGLRFSGGNNSEEAQKAQAAAYCLAYYKAEANDQIEAIIYDAQTDNSSSPENFGLYTRKEGTNNEASVKKSIYRVFRYIDTEFSSVVTEQYLSYYGLISWGEAVSGYDPTVSGKKLIISGSATTETPSNVKNRLTRIFDFSGSSLDFYPSENARLVTTKKDDEGFALYGSEYSLISELSVPAAVEYRGVSSTSPSDMTGAEAIVLDLKVSSETPSVSDVLLRITGKDETGREVIYEGIAASDAESYYRFYFDVREFTEKCASADRISIWVKPHNSAENALYELSVNGISAIVKSKGASVGGVIKTVVFIIIGLVAVTAAAYGIMYLRALIIYKKKKRNIETKRKDQRNG